jgi:hypothetical protein
MAGANSNIQVTELDFNAIKNNLKTYLQSQDVLKDYNYEGSALSVLLDVLAYNTQYNAYYLNMVANEMFLDTALQRDSVVSQAKLLDYTPKSATAPVATINLTVNQVNDASLTLPKFTNFMSEAIDGVNYNFVTTDSVTVNVSANTAVFSDVDIRQGIPTSQSFIVDSITNPKYIFTIPESQVDTSTLSVTVQVSSSNTYSTTYTLSKNYLSLDPDSTVYFLQETVGGNYQIYFGDGIIGKKLTDGNIVNVSYIVTEGTSAAGANNFVLMDTISGYSNTAVSSILSASNGSEKESIDSIKFQAPKTYSAQSRAVTKEDYITSIQQNKLGLSFDAVNVWGGEQNDPPVYGKVFVSLKPSGGYNLTQTQKQKLIADVIRPISVMTVEPTIVDPDYTYLKLNVNVLYDSKKTTSTASQIATAVKNAILSYSNTNLNTFNSTFSSTDLSIVIKNANPSIITNEVGVQLQKKFFPTLGSSTNYKFYYGSGIKKNNFLSGISSSPSFKLITESFGTINDAYFEELASSTGGVETISIVNPGFGYQSPPKVTIIGDGTGATATAKINDIGSVSSITITNPGNNYTSARVTFTPVANDTTGQGAVGSVNLEGRNGVLRTYFYDSNSKKTIINQTAGTIEYENGILNLADFNPSDVNDPLGLLTLTVEPTTTIISSSYNRIITIDEFDPVAITVNVTAKT